MLGGLDLRSLLVALGLVIHGRIEGCLPNRVVFGNGALALGGSGLRVHAHHPITARSPGMKVLGIDPGASCGICVLEVRGPKTWYVADDVARDPFASPWIDEPGLELVCIETVSTAFPRDRFG